MLTLAQVEVGMQNKIASPIIDEFRKSSWLLDNLLFDDTSILGAGGSSWQYNYFRYTQQSDAQVRAYGANYTPSEASKTEYSVRLKILGGRFQTERAFENTSGSSATIAEQLLQKRKAVTALFNNLVINGDEGTNPDEFDGLDAILAGSSTEYIPATPLNLSDTTAIAASADRFSFEMNDWFSTMDSLNGMALLCNREMVGRIRAAAIKLSAYTVTLQDIVGGTQRNIENIFGVPFIDLGERNGSSLPVVPTTAKLTSIYAVRIGADGFHGIMPNAQEDFVKVYLPSPNSSDVVRNTDLEMISAVALKSTKAAGVFRNIQVQA
jgi:hypothetical protein